ARLPSSRIEVLRASDLTEEHRQSWREIQLAVPSLDSAFFHPEFTQVVNRVRGDVEVAVLTENGESVGFFPFQRSPRGIAQSVVGRLSEFHGVIARHDLAWQPYDLIKQTGLTAWYFDHLPVTQTRFAPYHWGQSTSPFIDIGSGYERYCEVIKQSSSSAISQIDRKARKLQREKGPIRYCYHNPTADALEKLIAWKGDQHRRTGRVEIFNHAWVTQLLHAVYRSNTNGFSGPVSTLYVGDELVAVHLGLRCDKVLHWWFPAYNRKYEKYSPGLILLLRILQQSGDVDISRLDLGKGPERYKAQYKTGDLAIAVGGIDRRLWVRNLRSVWHVAKRTLRASRWKNQFEKFMDLSNHLRERRLFR
ncbi:MAG: GNAT family N-acetyltransferase, partial [Pirellulales bacterium]|nr:GNAT family N-acetyltransferase [Pirellulales bacterium]